MTTRQTFLRETATGWWAQAPAKINLYLDILGRRADGFHDLQTLIAPVGLSDTLHLAPRPDGDPRITVTVHSCTADRRGAESQAEVPSDENNLVVRALLRLREALGGGPGIDVQLWKRIPVKAGMGGGSSDAAAALRAGARIWNAAIPAGKLNEIAAEIGSDVPALLHPGPVVCRGRGEIVEPVPLPSGAPCVFAQPPVGLGAGQVFSELRPSETAPAEPQRINRLQAALRHGRLGGISTLLLNRLERPAARLTDWIDRLRHAFAALPLAGHQMSGSGSVYFGLCENWRLARRAAAMLRQRDWGTARGEKLRLKWVGVAAVG